MAYNKAKEERKWWLWKAAEEKQLRSLGVGAEDIEKLRVHDWAVFNSDRRYYEKLQDAGTYLEEVAEDTAQPEVKTVEEFLDSIENQRLYQVLIVWLIFGCIVVSVCILILILSMWIKQRKYETGILLSIGITKGKIVFQYIVEVLLIAVVAVASLCV